VIQSLIARVCLRACFPKAGDTLVRLAKVMEDGQDIMATRRIFISFEYGDLPYKNLLMAWSKNPDFADFYINDQSITEPVDSENAAPVRRVISARIADATGLLCIVGEKTAKSGWVRWEIRKAIELNKRLIAVKVSKDCETPSPLIGAGATWALSFNFAAIKKAIEDAYTG